MSESIINAMSPLEKKRFRARRYKWIKKGFSPEEATTKALGLSDDNPMELPDNPEDNPERKPDTQERTPDDNPMTTHLNHYINWVSLGRQLPLLGICLVSTFLLVVEAHSFYETAGTAFPWLLAILVESGILALSIYAPILDFKKAMVWDLGKWVITKASLVALVAFSYLSVTANIISSSADKINKIHLDHLSSDDQALTRSKLKLAMSAKAMAVKYGDHDAAKREDANVVRYEALLKPAPQTEVLIAAEENRATTLEFSRLVALLLNVVVGHLIARRRD